jgi:hypothetical protein
VDPEEAAKAFAAHQRALAAASMAAKAEELTDRGLEHQVSSLKNTRCRWVGGRVCGL